MEILIKIIIKILMLYPTILDINNDKEIKVNFITDF